MNAYLGLALEVPGVVRAREHEKLTAIRRDLHAHPELGFEEHRTARWSPSGCTTGASRCIPGSAAPAWSA